MPKSESWTDYAKRLARGQLSLATAYALSSRNPKKKTKKKASPTPQQKRKSTAYKAGAGLARSKQRYEQAARMSQGK